MKKLLLVVFIGLFLVGYVLAAGGTADEAKAMVQKAVAFIKANGNEKAFAEFNNNKGQFVDRDLYIWVADLKDSAKCLAHGANSKLIGQSLIDFKDTDGKLFIKEIVDLANSKGSGWIDYKWTNPTTKNIDRKSVYFEKLNTLVVVCGFYKS
ncbi:MAG: histidine kinase [Desulfobacteraceae bacterium]|nr:MAG: histidine kinase [Desulfobacteraceae bacterium]